MCTLWCDLGVMFDFVIAKMFFAAIFETCFCHKDIWIAATDYYMYLYLFVFSILTDLLQLRNFTASSFKLIITAVIVQLNCLVLILCFYIYI